MEIKLYGKLYPTNKTELILSCKKITTICPEIGKLINLKYLRLYNNQITTICPEIGLLINLQQLFLNNNQITTICPEIGKLINLQQLWLENNQITTICPEIGKLLNLQTHCLDYNQITLICPKIGKLINLKYLYLACNQITTICPEICQLINLQKLDLSHNQITIIYPEVGHIANLQDLSLSYNQITTICPEISKLINLHTLNLGNNRITAICPEIGILTNLQSLSLTGNQITTICPEIGLLTKLIYFFHDNNPIEYVPPNVLRLINRQKHTQNIYKDNQNVHNSEIQESFKKALLKLLKYKINITYDDILNDLILNNSNVTSYIIEFAADDSVHSVLNLTFKEILLAVYQKIINHDHKSEILVILEEDMKSAECKCFTGRITRLVNCLSGFDDVHFVYDVVIKISDNEQISNVLSVMRSKYKKNDEFRENAIKQLLELGYDINVINEWIDNM